MTKETQSPKQMIITAIIAAIVGGGSGTIVDQLTDDVDGLSERIDQCCPVATPEAPAASTTAKATATATAEAKASAAPTATAATSVEAK